MAAIKERIIKDKKYYYLAHSYRKGKVVKTEEIYLGDQLPSNIEQIKKDFITRIYSQEWFEKFEHIKEGYAKHKTSLPPSALEKEQEQFSVRFTYNTNRIEGSTLSLKDTINLLERGITPSNKPHRDIKETEAHQKLFLEILNCSNELSLRLVLYWHKQLFKETKEDIAGKIRRHQVAISGSNFLPPSPIEVDLELRNFFSWYLKNKKKEHPLKLAALVHLKFVSIHPFADGNGRISRLMMNFVLNRSKYPLLDIPYPKRSSYYSALERTHLKKEESIFLQWFFKRYVEENRKYLKNINVNK